MYPSSAANPRLSRAAFLACVVVLLSSCSSVYYRTMETFGREKRDILVSRVKNAREDQEKAKEQVQTTYERFKELVGHDGGDLERTYNKLAGELEDCESRAGTLSERIASIEQVSADLFREWEKELEQYTSAELRRSSEQKLRETRARCGDLVSAMRRSEAKMEPVLSAFRDQVLFLKHNLNAQAVASLEGVAAQLDLDVSALIGDMDKAIAEADAFITQMGL